MPHYSHRRLALVACFIAVGVVLFIVGGYLETRNPRSNDEDCVALATLALGASLAGAGIGILFRYPMVTALLFAVILPPCLFALCSILFWAWVVAH